MTKSVPPWATLIVEHWILITLKHLVDGGWGEWRDTTTCDAPACGGGIKTQSRTCSRPYPRNGGAECTGINTRQIACYDFSGCPGNID